MLNAKNSTHLDCLFLFTPKFKQYFHPFNVIGFINILPYGLLSMAEFLKRNGYNAQVVHLGLERVVDERFSLEKMLKETRPLVVGISLHWHYQSYDAIELAREVKRILPDTFLVMGGYTATFFREEILRDYPFVDAIVKGEGEVPILKLVETVKNGSFSLQDVPNLTYIKDGHLIENEQSFTASDMDLSNYVFGDYTLLKNYTQYSKLLLYMPYDNRAVRALLRLGSILQSPLVYLCMARGCPRNCSFCAGRNSMKFILNRKKTSVRSVDSIIADLKRLELIGYNDITACFYTPENKRHFIHLFEEIKRHHLKININLDVYGLPDYDIIEAFYSCLGKGSKMLLVPYSGSETVRIKNSIHKYSNAELLDSLRHIRKVGGKVEVVFSSILPFEGENEVAETRALMKEIFSIFKGPVIFNYPVEITPGSPMYMNPEKFQIRRTVTSFNDFYNMHKIPYYDPGYEIIGMSKREMQLVRCNNYCLLGLPFSKQICRALHFITKKLGGKK